VLLALASCSPEIEPEPAAETSAEVGESSSLKLYVFDCGRVRFNDEQLDAVDFGFTAAETDVRELIVPCYVIEHDRGRMLWDGGLPSATADTEGWQNADGMEIRLDRTLGEQLTDIGLDFTSFDYMAFSHMHFDHVGVANEIEGGTLLIQQAEYDAAFTDEVTVVASSRRPATLPAIRSSSSTSKRRGQSFSRATCFTSSSIAVSGASPRSTSTPR
jgi:hypothetical protein